jgi:hypothetical protein
MGNFRMFFPMGIEHITDFNGLDHILFITALCLRYLWTDWRKLIVLVSAFTVGHSITLALSTLSIINVPQYLTEFFIAITIIITAINNCFVKDFSFKSKYPAMFGKNESIVAQLLYFNLGLEVGQLVIVSLILVVSYLLVGLLKVNRREYLLFISGGIAALAFQMAIDRLPIKKAHDNEKTVYMHYCDGSHKLC